MKVSYIHSERPFESYNDRSLNIQTYGGRNDFPQRVSRIVENSSTGKSCLKIYRDFIIGQGFDDDATKTFVVNSMGQTLDEVMALVAADLAKYNGFGIHVNYNALGEICELRHVPFEHLRFERQGESTLSFSKIAEYDDWTREFERYLGRNFDKKDIRRYDVYSDSDEVLRARIQLAGGFSKWPGQILYYSGDGPNTYPTPIYAPALTDMRTEEAVSNVMNRNATSNFIPAGALVDISAEEQSEEEAHKMQKQLQQFVGDMNGSTLMYLQVASKDEIPQFIKMTGESYDKAYQRTQEVIPDNIGRAFSQPPILRAVDVGAGFGADLMRNAYDYYNSRTNGEREVLTRTFQRLFRRWEKVGFIPDDFDLRPLSYTTGDSLLARFGQEAVDKILEIVRDTTTDDIHKRAYLSTAYGLTDSDIDKLIAQ